MPDFKSLGLPSRPGMGLFGGAPARRTGAFFFWHSTPHNAIWGPQMGPASGIWVPCSYLGMGGDGVG